MQDEEPSLETFATIAAAAGVRIEPVDLKVMRKGYLGLQGMLARLPQAPELFDEPALVFVPPRSTLL